MESNKDEALKCLSIAQRHLDTGNHSSARRFCEKSISLFPTLQASKLLQRIAKLEQDTTQDASSSSSHTSAADPHMSGAKHRQNKMQDGVSGAAGSSANEKRDYTREQAEVVRRIQACKVTDYYEILSLKKDCMEADIKKAYRKLALQLHPDKNGAPGADEAFKMVSKAFQILSDPEKRSVFDQFGADPDSRFAGMRSSNSHSTAFAHPFAGATFEGELSPEDLFNMFFGGGAMANNGFGGPVFTASFGPGGFRTTRIHLGGRRAAHHQEDSAPSPRTMLAQLAPLIILFLFTFLSAVPSIFSSPRTPNPLFSFTPSNRFSAGRETSGLNVKYYVNPVEFSAHPINEEIARMSEKAGRQSTLLERFERYVENSYKEQMYILCEREQERKQRRKEQKMGFLGIGTDWEAIKAINEEKIPTCEEYSRLVGR